MWFLVNDRVKLLAYRIFEPVKAETPSNLTPRINKTPSDLKPQIATRAYELYEKGHADQDWLQAEQEIRKDGSHP